MFTISGCYKCFLPLVGIFSHRIIGFIWEMQLSSFHLNRRSILENCSDPWSEVPATYTMAAEALGTFTLAVTSAVISWNNPDPLVGALVFASVVVLVRYWCTQQYHSELNKQYEGDSLNYR